MNGGPLQGRWDPIRELQREMGRLFDSLDPFQSLRHVRQYPPINVYDAGDGYVLSAQLPGLSAPDITTTRVAGLVLISALNQAMPVTPGMPQSIKAI